MKKNLYLISALFLVGTGLKAQPVLAPGASPDWKLGANTNPLANVIGTLWNPAGVQSQMWFTTGAAAPQYRMTIFGGGLTDFDGYVGIGNNLAGFVPQARVHMHQTGGTNITKYTNNGIGATAADGLDIGIRSTGQAIYITHEQNVPHTFFTNDGTATGNFFERMRINAVNFNGFIGMGNSGAFNALSQLHINTIGANLSAAGAGGEVFRTEGLNNQDNSWRLFTGPGLGVTTQKGRIFASPVGTPHGIGVVHPVDQYFNLDASQADMVFYANGTRPLGSAQQERMRITSEDNFNGTGVDVTRVGITRDAGSIVADPRAMLHIGNAFAGPTNSRGHRQWMDVGTYYSSLNSDMMYVGHQNITPNQNNSIVAFGSEPVNFNNPAAPGDRMLFRFINDPAMGNGASGLNGLEMARMATDGNNARMSIGTPVGPLIDPGNTLEIISSAGSPQPAGLRFRNLNCFGPVSPLCNPASPTYLSVDANGDVILVAAAASGGCCLGNLCGAAPNPLAGDYEIPMNDFNFSFSDPTTPLNDGQNFVRIGGPCSTAPRAKLDVLRSNTNNGIPTVIGGFFENQDVAFSTPNTGTAYGVYGLTNGKNSANYAFFGEASLASNNTGYGTVIIDPYTGGPNAFTNTGFESRVGDALNNMGINANASSGNPNTQFNWGGNFSANSNGPNMTGNFGVQSSAFNNSNGMDNIGVFSQAYNFNNVNSNVGVVGISYNFGAAANDIGIYGESFAGGFAGYFAGPIVTAAPPIIFSDSKIKRDVKPVENASELLNKLNPVTYMMKTEEFSHLHLPGQMQYGFIAQEVEKVIPELVSKASKPEFKDKEGKVISKGEELIGINYEGIIPILTKSLQEQITEVDALKKELAELKDMMKAQGNNQSTGNNIGTIELSDSKSIVLDQNVPNPFAEQTTINYVLPENVQRAQMLFYNSDGKLINSMELTERGKGTLNVFANDLSNGIYTYSLVVDGKIVDSKRMIKNK